MRLSGPASPHLTYCTNIHPGETWAEVRANLERHVLAVRRSVAPDRTFGVGLRLSGRAARELSQPQAMDELAGFLQTNDLYVFTINGFPYGAFHGQRVKEEVYRPDWGEEERLSYTDLLATLLAELLPDEPGLDGTISTVPIAFAPRISSPQDARATAVRIIRHTAHLHRLREQTGKRIILALEPEPCCYLETVDETVDYFQEHLLGTDARELLRRETGLAESAAEDVLREHLGVCLDACHMAVEFEDPREALSSLKAAGIRVPKVQISAGLRVVFSGDAKGDRHLIDQLQAFADPVYLHQVVESTDSGLRRYLDLPEALRGAASNPAPREWRIHFHVPLFREKLGAFQSTQAYVGELIDLLHDQPAGGHWEVETYTWDVLPEEYRREEVSDAVARELRWVLARAGE